MLEQHYIILHLGYIIECVLNADIVLRYSSLCIFMEQMNMQNGQ